ncbi:MAG TPA: DUF1761 domain-containing protein [Saprospiraceae bacterium]|nr:DUF1761 domain-containing protein [Saprospiraceae bacterium]
MQFSTVNFLAVVIGTFANFLFGFLWYAPTVFGKAWQKHTGLTNDQIKRGSVVMRFGPAIVLTFIMGLVLAAYLPMDLNWEIGAFGGLIMGAGVGATSLGMHYLFAKRSIHLYLIDAGYLVISMTIFGAIIAAMS